MNDPLTPEARSGAELRWGEPGFRPRRGELRIFERAALDRLTRSHPATPYLLVAPLALWTGARAKTQLDWAHLAPYVALGWLAWSLVEYLMHRFLFHFPTRGANGRVVTFLTHGSHHVHPEDPRRIAATPPQFGALLLLLWGLGALILPPGARDATFAGCATGYLAYELVHWRAHHARPRTRLGLALQRHHLEHHFRDPRRRFGISSSLWDVVLRTTGRAARTGPVS